MLTIQNKKVFKTLFPEIEEETEIRPFKPGEGYEESFNLVKKLEFELKKKISKGNKSPEEVNVMLNQMFDILNKF